MKKLAFSALVAAVAALTTATAPVAASVSPATADQASSGYTLQDVQDELEEITVRVESGQATADDGYMLATLSHYADKQQLTDIARLRGLLDIQAGHYETAARQFEALADDPLCRNVRWCRQVASILNDCPDGMVPGQENPLSDPAVLRVAVIQRAGEMLRDGLNAMQRGSELPSSKLDLLAETYEDAYENLQTAEALRGGCAVRYIRRCATERIAVLKQRTELLASKFDLDMRIMGRKTLPSGQYAQLLRGMLDTLEAVSTDLRSIQAVAADSPEDFAVELEWVADDLKSVARIRTAITAELQQIK